MGDHQHSSADVGTELSQNLQSFRSALAIQIPGWLVGENHAGTVGDSPSNGDPLHFTAT